MLSSFVKNSAIYYLSTVLTKGISFFLLPFYTHIFSKADYGVLEMVSILSTFTIVLFSLQLQEGVGRYYNELSSRHEIRTYTSTVAIFALCSFGLFLVLTILFADYLGPVFNLNYRATILAMASISLNGIFYFSQNQLSWKIQPFKQMVCALVYNLSTILITILLALKLQFGIESIFIGQVVGAVLGITLGWFFARKDLSFSFSFVVLKKLLTFSLPLIPNAIGIYLFIIVDRLCIEYYLGLEKLGIYSFASKIGSVLLVVNLGMSTALSPLVYKHYKESGTPEKMAMIFRYFTWTSFVAIILISLFSSPIVEFLAGREGYEEAIYYVPFILISVYFSSLTQFYPGLIIAKKTKMVSTISVSSGLMNLVLNFLLIPYYGIIGACIATVISSAFNILLFQHFSSKEYPVPIRLALVFFILGLIGFVSYLSLAYNYGLLINLVFFIGLVTFTTILFVKKSDLVKALDFLKGLKSKRKFES